MNDQPNQKQMLATFWQRLDKQYYDLNGQSMKLLHNLLTQSQSKAHPLTLPVYASYEQYRTIQDILVTYFKHSRKKIHTLNKQNIKKYLYIYESVQDKDKMQELLLQLSSVRQIIKESSGLSKKLQIRKLRDEEIELNQILQSQASDQSGEIDQLINQLEQEQQRYSDINVPNLLKLQAMATKDFVAEQITLTVNKKQFYLKKRRPLTEQQKDELNTIKLLIVKLQDKQTAESISKVQLDYKTNQALTWYDPHITDQVQIMELDQLSELQRLRYKDFDKVETFLNQSETYLLEVVQKQFNFTLSQLNENQIYFCHYCKQNVELPLVIQCTYSSETMGLPEYNEELTLSSRVQIDESKRNKFIWDYNVSNYQMKNGHLFCKRYFCQNCLKYECDVQVEEAQKKTWLCPLCQGICSCSRCQRSDILQKLKRMYTESGGELQDLDDQSYFEQLVSNKKKGGMQIVDKNGSKKETKEKKASIKMGGQKNLQSHTCDSTEKITNNRGIKKRVAEIFMEDEHGQQQDTPLLKILQEDTLSNKQL